MALPGFSFARRLRAGETVFCGWCSMPYPIVAETIGREGFPVVALESQHGLWDMGAMLTGVAAVRQSGAAPLVRVPVGDFVMVSRVLDYGAEGVIAPMINSAADARAFVAAAKYPPIGERSWGPHRVTTLAGIADQSIYLREANDNVITLAMIETTAALGERHGAFRRVAKDSGRFSDLLRRSDNAVDLAVDLRRHRVEALAAGERDREIGRTDVYAVDALYLQSLRRDHTQRARQLEGKGQRALAIDLLCNPQRGGQIL